MRLIEKRDYCSFCGHIVAQPKRGLSTVKFRRIVKSIISVGEL